MTEISKIDIWSCLEVWEMIIGICLGFGILKLELNDYGYSYL
jgi:hypothetical protein